MECVNCGKFGHTFRDCKGPVMSFGICAVKFVQEKPMYLMIRRRDSLAYVEFLRGKYKMDAADYIQLLINGMTLEERQRLLSMSFDKLWETLWNNQNTRQFRTECEIARRTFEALKNTGDYYGKLLSTYVSQASSQWNEPEWGFPKGRRALHETELGCALREFNEETGLSQKCVHILKDEASRVEEYTGTNGIPYKQVYFLGICSSENDAIHQPHNRVMNREVGAIGWFSYEDAVVKIRHTNTEKRAMLTALHTDITTTELGVKMRTALEWTYACRR
jgi:8-oxo-dGTP pyrophosphatase MutT (NUDIX family)